MDEVKSSKENVRLTVEKKTKQVLCHILDVLHSELAIKRFHQVCLH